jgi:hypothetical protein
MPSSYKKHLFRYGANNIIKSKGSYSPMVGMFNPYSFGVSDSDMSSGGGAIDNMLLSYLGNMNIGKTYSKPKTRTTKAKRGGALKFTR